MKELLYSVFPKLRSGGGFELCRCVPNTRRMEGLSSVALSSVSLLKERVGMSRTYIRPLQVDLALDEVTDETNCVSC